MTFSVTYLFYNLTVFSGKSVYDNYDKNELDVLIQTHSSLNKLPFDLYLEIGLYMLF